MKLILSNPIKNLNVSIDSMSKSLAKSNSFEQADFFNSFYRNLQEVCETKEDATMQLCMLVDDLDKDGIELIKALHEFIKINNENK